MLFEFIVKKGKEYQETLYIEFDKNMNEGYTEVDFKYFILGCFEEFRTHCVDTDKEANVFYFKNWARKYHHLEFFGKPKVVTVSVTI